ncbi:MAG: hypothetical protein PVJ02_08185 [Gemmatimonadota bacterium]
MSGLLLFVAGTASVLHSLGRQPGWWLRMGILALGVAVVCFGLGAWRIHTRVDWRRIEAEQRLWESGPLGRLWLKLRRTLMGR